MVSGEVYRNRYYPIIKEDGRVDKIVVFSRCITKNILMEKEVQQLEKMAGIGQLSAAIVHELKNSSGSDQGRRLYSADHRRWRKGEKKVDTIMKAVEEAENVISHTAGLFTEGFRKRGDDLSRFHDQDPPVVEEGNYRKEYPGGYPDG